MHGRHYGTAMLSIPSPRAQWTTATLFSVPRCCYFFAIFFAIAAAFRFFDTTHVIIEFLDAFMSFLSFDADTIAATLSHYFAAFAIIFADDFLPLRHFHAACCCWLRYLLFRLMPAVAIRLRCHYAFDTLAAVVIFAVICCHYARLPRCRVITLFAACFSSLSILFRFSFFFFFFFALIIFLIIFIMLCHTLIVFAIGTLPLLLTSRSFAIAASWLCFDRFSAIAIFRCFFLASDAAAFAFAISSFCWWYAAAISHDYIFAIFRFFRWLFAFRCWCCFFRRFFAVFRFRFAFDDADNCSSMPLFFFRCHAAYAAFHCHARCHVYACFSLIWYAIPAAFAAFSLFFAAFSFVTYAIRFFFHVIDITPFSPLRRCCFLFSPGFHWSFMRRLRWYFNACQIFSLYAAFSPSMLFISLFFSFLFRYFRFSIFLAFLSLLPLFSLPCYSSRAVSTPALFAHEYRRTIRHSKDIRYWFSLPMTATPPRQPSRHDFRRHWLPSPPRPPIFFACRFMFFYAAAAIAVAAFALCHFSLFYVIFSSPSPFVLLIRFSPLIFADNVTSHTPRLFRFHFLFHDTFSLDAFFFFSRFALLASYFISFFRFLSLPYFRHFMIRHTAMPPRFFFDCRFRWLRFLRISSFFAYRRRHFFLFFVFATADAADDVFDTPDVFACCFDFYFTMIFLCLMISPQASWFRFDTLFADDAFAFADIFICWYCHAIDAAMLRCLISFSPAWFFAFFFFSIFRCFRYAAFRHWFYAAARFAFRWCWCLLPSTLLFFFRFCHAMLYAFLSFFRCCYSPPCHFRFLYAYAFARH